MPMARNIFERCGEAFEAEFQNLGPALKWAPKKKELAAVSATVISNETHFEDSVLAFDSYEFKEEAEGDGKSKSGEVKAKGFFVKEWLDQDEARRLVWHGCKAAIEKGRYSIGGDEQQRITIRRVFVVGSDALQLHDKPLSCALPGATDLKFPGMELLLLVMWAQQMIGVQAWVVTREQYQRQFQDAIVQFRGVPDYAVIASRAGVNKGRKLEVKKCIGWNPEGIWYPEQEGKWPLREQNPVEHFEAALETCKPLRPQDVLAMYLEQLNKADHTAARTLSEKVSQWSRFLKMLDPDTFERFASTWKTQIESGKSKTSSLAAHFAKKEIS